MVAVSNALGDAFDLEVGIVIAPEAIQQLVAKTIGDQVELMGVDPTTSQPAEVVRAVTSEFRSRVATLLSAELKVLELDRFVDRATHWSVRLPFSSGVLISVSLSSISSRGCSVSGRVPRGC
jgi:hypothetical protein